MTTNHLGRETSPYLLQHRDNPVHWYPWGTDALAEAKASGKPILLSVGYAACHWCHVMAHESFENPDTAALMNEHFVNVKVDREERPDLDHIYQSALAMLGEHGGWPLTMFLTPEAEPFWGGTYFPPAARYGRPGFPDILREIARTYHADAERITKNVSALRDGLKTLAQPEGGGSLDTGVLDQAATLVLRNIDPITGGTLGAPKFPQPAFFGFLWRAYKRSGSPLFRDAVVLTLDHMCQGGIYDHLGGGFARYSTDEVWLAPHFEKMLYDNALLIELLIDVFKETRSPLYETRLRETLAWVLTDMANGTGDQSAFASAYDADSEGEEGRFYVWSEREIDEVLGAQSADFKETYDVSPWGNWEGKVILNRSSSLALKSPEEEAALTEARTRLLERRAGREPPGRDDKVLTDWNGLMIAALTRAAVFFEEPDWLARAREAFDFVTTKMTQAGRLLHSWCAGRALHPATLDDYANMARAALLLFEATGEREYLDRAIEWAATADRHYWDEPGGGYYLSADDTEDVITRPKTAQDNAVPPGNGTMVEVLARLFFLTGDAGYREKAERTLAALTPEDRNKSVYNLTLLAGYEFLEGALQCVLVGANREARKSFRDAYTRLAPPASLLVEVDDTSALPENHPAAGKAPVDGRVTAYICVGQTCDLPITELDSLEKRLNPG